MKTSTVLLAASLCLVLQSWTASGQVNLTTPGISYTQSFDTLAIAGTSSVPSDGLADE